MKRSVRLSPMLLLVALSPVFFQTAFSCERGDTFLLSLEFEAYGQDRIAGFNLTNRDYALFNSSPTAIVRTVTRDPGSTVTYDLSVGGTSIEVGTIGVGGGEVTINVPVGQSQLTIAVRAPEGPFGISTGRYRIDINPPCVPGPGECDDGNSCSTDVCNASVCEFTTLADGVVCDDGNGNLDVCSGGVCGSNAVTRSIPMSCVDNVFTDQHFPTEFELVVDPLGPVVAGQPFDAQFSVTEASDGPLNLDLLAGYAGALLTRIAIVESLPVTVRSGAAGSAVAVPIAAIPTTCTADVNGMQGRLAGPFPACDPANDIGAPDGQGFFANSDCVGVAGVPLTLNPCLPYRDFTIIDGSSDACAACDALGGPLNGQSSVCLQTGFCATLGESIFEFDAVVASFSADDATKVLFGFGETGFPQVIGPTDGFNVILQTSVPYDPLYPASGFLAYRIECQMGAHSPEGTGGMLLGDASLASLPISGCVPQGICGDGTIDTCEECDDGNIIGGDGCESDCTILNQTLFACSEEGIANAIAAGGGPLTFDCSGPTTIATSSEIVLYNDAILDGEGELTIDAGGTHRALSVQTDILAELHGLVLTGGNLDPGHSGGGIYNLGDLVVTGSTVTGNSAQAGGGIESGGVLTVSDSFVTGNTGSSCCAGIRSWGSDLLVIDSTIASNQVLGGSAFGAGISGAFVIVGSTIAQNDGASAVSGSGLLLNTTVSGNTGTGVSGTASLINVTTSGNASGLASGSLTVRNSVIADGCTGPVLSAGNNIESPGDTCGFADPSDQVNVTPVAINLGALQDNGGPTDTVLPGTGSVAIDQIPAVDCVDDMGAPLTTDQRGITRPQGTLCDIGAVEVEQP